MMGVEKDLIDEVRSSLGAGARCPKHEQPYVLFNTNNQHLSCLECAFPIAQANQRRQGIVSLNSNHLMGELIRKFTGETDKKVHSLEQNITVCKKNMDLAQQVYSVLLTLLDKEFSEIFEALEKRKQQLRNTLESMLDDTLKSFTSKTHNLEFLRSCFLDSKELLSLQNTETDIQFLATYATLKDTLSKHNFQPSLLTKDHFNVLELRGQVKLKSDIENFGKIIRRSCLGKAGERPKSMPRPTRATGLFLNEKKGEFDPNEYQYYRTCAKSAEKLHKDSHIYHDILEHHSKLPSFSHPRNAKISNLPSPLASARIVDGDSSRRQGATPNLLSSRERVPSSRVSQGSRVMKNQTTKNSLNRALSKKELAVAVVPNSKEDRQKRRKMMSIDLYDGINARRKRTHTSSYSETMSKGSIHKKAERVENVEGLFEEFQTLECSNTDRIDEEVETSSDVYREVESMLSTIKRKEIIFPQGADLTSSLLFHDSSILRDKSLRVELSNFLPQGVKVY